MHDVGVCGEGGDRASQVGGGLPASARTSSGRLWSTRTGIPAPPAAVIRSAVSSIVSGRPSSERPEPLLRPVT
nr:hypothetical protein [Actinomadura latina]